MANAQSNVTVNISANTADLDAKLAKQEAAIKTLDGAINVLGGSVELAASALVATGLASEESADKFEKAAVGAIAFADGSKRVLDGVKSLNEGLKAYGGVAQAASAAQKALNAAVLANPYVLAAAAVTALVAAIVIFTREEDKAAKALELSKKAYEEESAAINANNISRKSNIELLQAQGASQEQILKQQLQNAQQAKDEATNLRVRLQLLNKFSEETKKAREDEAEAIRQVDLAQARLTTFQANQAKAAQDKINAGIKKEREEREAAARALNGQKTDLQDYVEAQKEQDRRNKEAVETFIELSGGIQQTTGTILRQLPVVQGQVETTNADLTDYFNNLITKQQEFFDSQAGEALSTSLAVASQLATTLRENVDESTKEGFEKGKKYRIAEVRVSSIQAAFEAYKGLVGVPYVGQFLAIAAAAAALASGQKAIQDIQSSTFQGGGKPSNPTTGAASIGGGAVPGATQQGGFLALAPPTTAAPPVRAYVVTGDVTDGIEAEQQLQTRRQFGPG